MYRKEPRHVETRLYNEKTMLYGSKIKQPLRRYCVMEVARTSLRTVSTRGGTTQQAQVLQIEDSETHRAQTSLLQLFGRISWAIKAYMPQDGQRGGSVSGQRGGRKLYRD
jgi:hypothetical protein